MKNIYLLSNLTKTSVSRRIDSVSLPSRCRVIPIILLFLTAFSLHAWGADYSQTFTKSDLSSMLSGSYLDASSYWKVPETSGNTATVAIPSSCFSNQPTSNVTITLELATYGSGTNPSSSNTTISAVGAETGSNWTGANVSKYPSSSTFVNAVLTISKPVSPTTLSGLNITISVNTGVKILRLKSITIAYTYSGGGGGAVDPTITFNNGSYTIGGADLDLTTLFTSNSSGAVTYSVSNANGTGATVSTSGTDFSATTAGTCTVQASQAASGSYNAKTVTATITINAGGGGGSGDYELIESAGDIEEGEYLIVYDNTYALNTHNGNINANTYGTYTDISSYYENKTIASNSTTDQLAYTVAATTNGYSFYKASEGTYLGTQSTSSTGPQLRWDDSFTLKQNEWTLGVNSIVSVKTNTLAIRWNNGSPRFAIYGKTGQQAVQLFKKASGPIKVTSSFTEFTYVFGGGPSASQTFKVEGTDLAGNLTITAPTNYQVSQNGSSWSNSVTLNKNAGDDVPETTLYIRLNSGLAKGDYDGNITFSDGTNNKMVAVEGSVTLSCATPSISFTEATVNKYRGDADFKITPSVSGNTLGAAISWSSDKESCATVGSDGTVHIIKATGAGAYVRITATLPYTETAVACQNEVSAYYDIYIKNKITWLVSGATYTAGGPDTEVTEGAKITTAPTDPDGSSMCGGKTFVGWTTSEVAVEQATAPSPLYSATTVKDVNITDNTTFYAVFAESGGESADKYKKVTSPASEMTTGKRVLIVHNSSSKAMSNTESGIGYAGVSVTPDGEGKITTTNSAIIWTVIKGTTGFFFHQGDNYINAALDKNSNHYLWIDEYPDEWTLTGSGPYVLHSTEDPGYQFECYSNIFQTYTGTSGDAYNMDFYVSDIGYTAYSTTCGPNIKAGEVERLTSTLGQIVRSQAITIKGSSLTGGTLSVKSITGDDSQFTYTLASQTITAGAIETTYTISYIPTVYDATHTAKIIFWDGTTESDPITLRGRSLPEYFAIVAYDGANYYALDGSMTGTASSVRPMPVTVTAGVVDNCPERGVYSLTDLDTPDQNVHLTSATGRLYGEGGGTGLNIHSFTSTSGTGWLLTTTDFVNYHVTNATTTTRGIMYSSLYNSIGHYNTINYGKANYYGEIQFLPFANVCTCLDAPQNVTVVAKATKAIITWDEVESAIGYEVSCVNASTSATEGSISIDAVNHTATITGLTNLTNYNFTVKAVATGNDCSLAHSGHFKTTNCDDVPYGIRVTPAINSATFKWSMESATATIRLYSDEECTIQVGSDHTGLTSPATITGLAENTQYYAKIFAGGTCESGVIDFMTNSPSVEIAEWFPDSIRIIIDAGADASVIIEDKQEHGSSSGTVAEKVFISKYFEADGNNKMIAIFNGTLDTVDITNYWLYRSEINASERKFCLKNFGKTPGKIAPNEEIIIMRFTSDNDPAIKCAEAEDNFDDWNIIPSTPKSQQLDGEGNDIYQWLQFSGPQSIGLYDNNPGVQKFIDVIGATTSTGELVQIEASNKNHCSATENSDNDGSGFFADGKNVKDGSDIVLSTNRCLLIRKNTVVSGDNAVAKNVYSTQQECSEAIGKSFQTLGEEWLGFIIGKGDDAADKTCEGLAYVGGFDYSGYYTTYDSIGGIKDLTGQQNDDGTYTIPIPELDTLSCTMMRIKVYEGGMEKALREYQVPIMVEETKTTTDTIFQNKWHDLETCKTCDVVILKGATLTKAENGLPKDAATVGNLTIYPGGTMNIPNSRTFNVASVQFRVEGENVPFIKLSGMLHTSDQQVLVSRRINNSDAYFFSLPYDCNISDIRWSNGEPAVLDNGFRIKEYDSRARADEGSTKGAPGHWKMVTGSTLEAGKGYQISVNSKYLKELIFPLDLGKTNVSDAENEKAPHGDNIVPIHQYTNGATTINNHNWNFIAQPYLCAMKPMAGAAITYGYLDWKVENDEVVWERKEVGNQYLTIYDPSSKTYTQKFWNAVSQLDPFLAFFVQGKAEGTFTFVEGNRLNNAPARHLASQAEVDEDPSIFVGVTLSGNGLTDQANLRVRQDFTEEEYKLGYDLLKFTTYYKDRPQVYMKTPSYQLAFQAVNDSVAKNTFLPMGVYCYKPGTYTFGLSNDYPIDEVEAVYLYDKVSGVTTNLLYDTYTITTSSQLYTNTRFALNVIVNRRAPQVTTDIGIPEAPDNMVRKILINGHVYIQRGAAIYDITGKQMLNF